MLVLTIKEGQKIHVGDEITVSFYHRYNYEKRESKAVKLKVNAPSDVTILREEFNNKT
ncbi:carbon storage regulator [Pontibacterium granulatum]|uniref:carbon storage regulator n=1 Tax=Pontibacterium granulatum TaxID=2036029 RepID=UPI00249B6942|nr:carbon storage regulator [Pontibacterium granulatum]MDI3324744.1 carbon storage regulator [Pontibacterium granulatum]